MLSAILWGIGGIVVGLLLLNFVVFPFLDRWFDKRAMK